jgi:Flp pilus assembly protein CpaB
MKWQFSAPPPRASFLPLTHKQFEALSNVERVTYVSLALRAVTTRLEEVLASQNAEENPH